MANKVLAEFINEVPVGSEAMVSWQTQYTIDRQKDCKEEWILYKDGASSVKGFSAGLVLISPTNTEYTYALRLNFESTNNQAEYEALLAGLRIAKKMGVQSMSVNVDSKLVVSQINDNYRACKENMIRYLYKAKEYINLGGNIGCAVNGRGGDKCSGERRGGNIDDPHHQLCRNRGMARRPKRSMCLTDEHSQLRHPRDTHESMHHAFKSKVGGRKGHPTRILLANDAPRRKRINMQVRFMPYPLPNTQAPQNVNDFNHGTLTILSLENRCPRGKMSGLVKHDLEGYEFEVSDGVGLSFDLLRDYMMVVKEIVNRLLEEVEIGVQNVIFMRKVLMDSKDKPCEMIFMRYFKKDKKSRSEMIHHHSHNSWHQVEEIWKDDFEWRRRS
nr:reverse transcriptase domain-containing protein [Tanacetum cinerariifolium]